MVFQNRTAVAVGVPPAVEPRRLARRKSILSIYHSLFRIIDIHFWRAYCYFGPEFRPPGSVAGKDLMKKRTDKLNRLTGEPREWVCEKDAAIDFMLEKAEMWRYFARLARETGAEFAMEVMPPEILRKIVASERANLDLLEKFMNSREPLTEAEKRYCEAEDIPLEDFIRRLPDV